MEPIDQLDKIDLKFRIIYCNQVWHNQTGKALYEMIANAKVFVQESLIACIMTNILFKNDLNFWILFPHQGEWVINDYVECSLVCFLVSSYRLRVVHNSCTVTMLKCRS